MSMADHDQELWHAIGRLAMVVEKLNSKPVNLGGLFGGVPEEFTAGTSKPYKVINGLIKTAGTDKDHVSKLLKDIDARLKKNQHDSTEVKIDSMKVGLAEEKKLLESARKAVDDLVHGFDPYIATLTQMKTALANANVSNTALNKAKDAVSKADDSTKKANEALDKAKEALKKAEETKLEKTRNDENEIEKCNKAVAELTKAEETINNVRDSTRTILKNAGLSL